MRAAVRWLGWLLYPLVVLAADSSENPPTTPNHSPRVAIIIDDLGNNLAQGERTLALPGAVTVSILPLTPFADQLARLAHARGKEVMIHLPMQAIDPLPLGPGGIFLGMNERQLKRTLIFDLATVPYAVGANNHMGSLLTQHPQPMRWVMQVLQQFGLYFVDSRTSELTRATEQAHAIGLRHLQRDVFLDTLRGDADYVQRQFDQLELLAIQNGHAVAIGHPYPATLAVLAERIPRLIEDGLKLVSVSTLFVNSPGGTRWQASLSPSPKAAKN